MHLFRLCLRFFTIIAITIGIQASSEGSSRLISAVSRVLTASKDRAVDVPRSGMHAFLSTHHMKRLRYSEEFKSKVSYESRRLMSQQDVPLEDLYEEIASRLITKMNDKTLQESELLQIPTNQQKLIRFEQQERNFVYGHQATIVERELQFPLILVSAFSKSAVQAHLSSSVQKKNHNWYLPWEQALRIHSLGEYRDCAALLKWWGAYSDAVLCYVPKGAQVSMHMGLTAMKGFPGTDDATLSVCDKGKFWAPINLKDADEIKKSAKSLEVEETYLFDRLKEYNLPGGSTQFFIGAASESYLFPLNMFRFPVKMHFVNNYAAKGEPRGTWQKPKSAETLHFEYEGYDETRVCLLTAMEELELFTADESKSIRCLSERIRCLVSDDSDIRDRSTRV